MIPYIAKKGEEIIQYELCVLPESECVREQRGDMQKNF